VSKRTTAQVALLIVGMVLFGYGVAVDEERLRLMSLAFFIPAFVLRFFRGSDTRPHRDDDADVSS
jgi:hypothetical protein